MAQPTFSGLELNAGSGGGAILHDVVDSKVAQVVLQAFSTGDGTLNVVMSDAPLPVTDAAVLAKLGTSIAVTGTFWQATQPISAAALPLPAGASTSAKQDTGNASLASIDGKVTACNTGAVVISSGVLTTVSAVTAITNALPAGDNNIGNVDIVTLPAANLGQQAMAASLSVVPASNVTDETYIGDIKFGEALPAGTAEMGFVGAAAQSGYVYDGATKCTVKRFHAVTNTSGTAVIPAPTGTKKIRVLSMVIIGLSATPTNVYFESGTTGTDCFGTADGPIPVSVDADGNQIPGVQLGWNPGGWFEVADADEAMDIVLSAAQYVLVCGNYIEVA
ncbi:MAG TPA: hypothetical protein VM243_11910 [Phycisphaerae bacterium]|nr:hypothetical protein [Phycisphaerae bacterium]